MSSLGFQITCTLFDTNKATSRAVCVFCNDTLVLLLTDTSTLIYRFTTSSYNTRILSRRTINMLLRRPDQMRISVFALAAVASIAPCYVSTHAQLSLLHSHNMLHVILWCMPSLTRVYKHTDVCTRMDAGLCWIDWKSPAG